MNWLINASVWVQTPVVVAALLVFAVAVAWVLHKLLMIVMPRSEEEWRVLGVDPLREGAGRASRTEKKTQKVEKS